MKTFLEFKQHSECESELKHTCLRGAWGHGLCSRRGRRRDDEIFCSFRGRASQTQELEFHESSALLYRVVRLVAEHCLLTSYKQFRYKCLIQNGISYFNINKSLSCTRPPCMNITKPLSTVSNWLIHTPCSPSSGSCPLTRDSTISMLSFLLSLLVVDDQIE